MHAGGRAQRPDDFRSDGYLGGGTLSCAKACGKIGLRKSGFMDMIHWCTKNGAGNGAVFVLPLT
jgi:hypothetical protein